MVHTQTEQLRQKLEQLLLPPSNLAGHGMLWHRNHEFRLIHAHHFSRVGIDPLVPSQRLPIGPHVLNTCRTCAEHVPSNARWKIPNSKKDSPPYHHPTTIQPPSNHPNKSNFPNLSVESPPHPSSQSGGATPSFPGSPWPSASPWTACH